MTSETAASTPTPVGNEHGAEGAPPSVPPTKKLFGVPAPVKQIFDRFPLVSYQAEAIPGGGRTNESAKRNRLFVFIEPEQATKGAPSFNPQCLRWQVSRSFQNNNSILDILS